MINTNSSDRNRINNSLPKRKRIGEIDILDPTAKLIFDENAYIEILGEGYKWAEGALWIPDEQMLLFSDIPNNRILSWKEEFDQPKVYMEPSGFTQEGTRGGELGSNALILSKTGELIMCQHGDRRIAKMDAPITKPISKFITVADNYKGQPFNSPNDLAEDHKGNIYFSDPTYGLESESYQEIAFSGLYKIDTNGEVHLIQKHHTHPNGIAFSLDDRFMYITNSNPAQAHLYRYELSSQGEVISEELIFDYTPFVSETSGNPDGLKVDRYGNIITTGPDGLWVFNQNIELIARVYIPFVTSNCSFTEDFKTLYITASDKILRLKLRQ